MYVSLKRGEASKEGLFAEMASGINRSMHISMILQQKKQQHHQRPPLLGVFGLAIIDTTLCPDAVTDIFSLGISTLAGLLL